MFPMISIHIGNNMDFLLSYKLIWFLSLGLMTQAHVIQRRSVGDLDDTPNISEALRTPQKYILEPIQQTLTKKSDTAIVPPPYDAVDFGVEDKFNEIEGENEEANKEEKLRNTQDIKLIEKESQSAITTKTENVTVITPEQDDKNSVQPTNSEELLPAHGPETNTDSNSHQELLPEHGPENNPDSNYKQSEKESQSNQASTSETVEVEAKSETKNLFSDLVNSVDDKVLQTYSNGSSIPQSNGNFIEIIEDFNHDSNHLRQLENLETSTEISSDNVTKVSETVEPTDLTLINSELIETDKIPATQLRNLENSFSTISEQLEETDNDSETPDSVSEAIEASDPIQLPESLTDLNNSIKENTEKIPELFMEFNIKTTDLDTLELSSNSNELVSFEESTEPEKPNQITEFRIQGLEQEISEKLPEIIKTTEKLDIVEDNIKATSEKDLVLALDEEVVLATGSVPATTTTKQEHVAENEVASSSNDMKSENIPAKPTPPAVPTRSSTNTGSTPPVTVNQAEFVTNTATNQETHEDLPLPVVQPSNQQLIVENVPAPLDTSSIKPFVSTTASPITKEPTQNPIKTPNKLENTSPTQTETVAVKPIRTTRKPITTTTTEKLVNVVHITTPKPVREITPPLLYTRPPTPRTTKAPSTTKRPRTTKKPNSERRPTTKRPASSGINTNNQNQNSPVRKPSTSNPTTTTQKPPTNPAWFPSFPSLPPAPVLPAFFVNPFNTTSSTNQTQSTFGFGFLAVPWNWRPLNFTNLFTPNRIIDTPPPRSNNYNNLPADAARDLAFWNALFHRGYTNNTEVIKQSPKGNTTQNSAWKPWNLISGTDFFKMPRFTTSNTTATIPSNTQVLHLYFPLKYPFQGQIVTAPAQREDVESVTVQPAAVSNKIEFIPKYQRSPLMAETAAAEKGVETVVENSVKSNGTEKASLMFELELPRPVVQFVKGLMDSFMMPTN